jgi:trimethylamine--corrinoid protein Co-methyltransferase
MSSSPGRRRTAGRDAKRAARQKAATSTAAFIERKIPFFEVLDTEALELIEHNADTVLEEIGIEFKDFPQALALFKAAGADIDGERVRFPRGLCRSIVQASAPAEFVQHARNPERNVTIGGKRTVLVPAYGSPFVRDLDNGRRYAAIEDFRNFVKLAYMSPGIHHSGGTVCEPVDIPVNKRHFDMIYSHIKYSDKPFMGSVTAPERAQDTVDMAKIVFGDDFIQQNTVITSLINANSPMTFDATMLGAATVYAENNQATMISPFLIAGAMSPVTVAGTVTQILAEALAGMAYVQLVRPGAPVIFGTFADVWHARAILDHLCGCGTRTPPGCPVPQRRWLMRLQGCRCAGGLRIRQYADQLSLGRRKFHAAYCRLAGRRPRDGIREIHHGCGSGQYAGHIAGRR